MASDIKIICSARHALSAPMNMPSAKNPHSPKNAVSRLVLGASASPIFGKTRREAKVSQKNPRERNMVVANVLPFDHSLSPLRSGESP